MPDEPPDTEVVDEPRAEGSGEIALDKRPTKEVIKMAKKLVLSMAVEDPVFVAEFLEAWAKRIRETGCIDVVIPVDD